MKKYIALVTAVVCITNTSCTKLFENKDHHGKHEKTEVKETINVEQTINAGDTYTYAVPTNQSDDAYQITQQATLFTKSELNTDASNNVVYTFVPVVQVASPTSYTQDITIANVEEEHTGMCGNNGGAQHNGKDMHETEIERTIHIHLTINPKGSQRK